MSEGAAFLVADDLRVVFVARSVKGVFSVLSDNGTILCHQAGEATSSTAEFDAEEDCRAVDWVVVRFTVRDTE